MREFSVPMPKFSSLKRSTKPIRARKKRSKDDPIVRVMGDGREICDIDSAEGMRIYRSRVLEMRLRQRSICCLHRYCPNCPGYLPEHDTTFEHEAGRGTGGHKRDDRIELPDGTWINGAAHAACNHWKGSRNIPYNVPFNSFAKGMR